MENINFEQTGGAFGVKRVLGTFTLSTAPNGCIIVSDDFNNGRAVGFGFATVTDAVKAYKAKDDYRLIPR